jgi:hypothetical protein
VVFQRMYEGVALKVADNTRCGYPCRRTVIVEKIPLDLRSRAKITAYFETMYPGAVSRVNLCQVLSEEDPQRNHRDDRTVYPRNSLEVNPLS